MRIQTINPANEQLLASYDCLTQDEISMQIELSHRAFEMWKNTSFQERKILMLKLAKELDIHKNELAELMAKEMGKPITAGLAEIDKCGWVCNHYAEYAESYLAPRVIDTEMKSVKVMHMPLGTVFAIMPWNFPFWQVFRFAVPTIMAGNTAILKHAPISSGTGNRIEELFIAAGYPKHVFKHMIVDNDGASEIIANEHVRAVTLTGSEQAGSHVAAQAGNHLKKVVLELGGSDPYIILEDADLEWAAECIVKSRLNNSGQVCIAAKRIIVVESVYEKLLSLILKNIASHKMGDPFDPKTTMGPLARKDLREHLHQQVLKSVKQGAKLLLGGIIPTGPGFYYPPTVLTDVTPGICAFNEELFGPVIVISKVNDELDAISTANLGKFGLGAAIFTSDLVKGEHIATYQLEAGTCFVNQLVYSDPRVPFGGVKHSGFGRELGKEGILEFVNVKTIGIHEPK